MKIVNLKTFLDLPDGTLFSKYEPHCFHGFSIKTESIKDLDDFRYHDLIGNIKDEGSDDFANKCELAEKGESIKLYFNCEERDGLYKFDQLFAIYEKDDVVDLIARLNMACYQGM